jgi:hypothetical protein
MKKVYICCLSMFSVCSLSLSQEVHTHQHGIFHKAPLFSPADISRDHVMPKGQFMLTYRYMYMWMGNYYAGTHKLPTDASIINSKIKEITGNPGAHGHVFSNWMKMQMHMVELMYGLTDKLTVMGMVQYTDKEMRMFHHDGKTDHASRGLGDIVLSADYLVAQSGGNSLIVGMGVSLPTGKINKTHVHIIHGEEVPLRAYSMQLGSGTYDLLPSLTYTYTYGKLGAGLQANATIRTGRNKEGYRFGHVFGTVGWVGYMLSDFLVPNVSVRYSKWGGIKGEDKLNKEFFSQHPTFKDPDFQPDYQGGERVDVGVGLNAKIKGITIGIDFVKPVYQKLNGIQMGVGYYVSLKASKAF